MATRAERDSLGWVDVPEYNYWGAQTQRSLNNFKIGHEKMPMEVIYAFAYLKKAIAQVNHDCGVLSEEKSESICRVCDEILSGKFDTEFPLSVWQTGSGTQTNMNVNEVIANRAHILKEGSLDDEKKFLHPNDDVNKSQSSNDTFPTAMHIAAYKLITEKTIPNLEKLSACFRRQSQEFLEVVKIGRTHFMDATPLTLGQEFSAYASQIDHGLESLRAMLSHLLELAIGGTAVGTGINTPKDYAEKVAHQISSLTSFPFVSAKNKFEALSAHDAIVKVSGGLKTLAVSLMKIGNDIRMLSSGPRCGIGEIMIPANEPGSSIMPGKVNPTQCEALTMVCAQVIGNDTTISVAGSNGHFQLNVYKPVMIYTLLASARNLGDAALSFHDNCVQNIKPNLPRIKQNLENSLMLVTALNTHIGYDNAAKIAKKAYAENKTLKEVAIELKLVNSEDFDEWVDPQKMIGDISNLKETRGAADSY